MQNSHDNYEDIFQPKALINNVYCTIFWAYVNNDSFIKSVFFRFKHNKRKGFPFLCYVDSIYKYIYCSIYFSAAIAAMAPSDTAVTT